MMENTALVRSTRSDPAGDLLDRAMRQTGLADFGDPGFRTGLRVLAAAITEADLPEDTRNRVEARAMNALVHRLQVTACFHDNPAIAQEEITDPLIVIGLPRTGTTALVDMLAQDPAARTPMQWEIAGLSPPANRAGWANDPRIAEHETRLQAQAGSPVAALNLHTYGAMLPEECNSLLELEMWSPNLSVMAHLPRYDAWLRGSHAISPYAFHHRLLQYLQHHGPVGRWTLKSPFHLFDLPALVAQYPGAMIVQTHRDPVAVLPSICGLISFIRGETPGDAASHRTARELCALWGAGMRRAVAARLDPALDARIVDISHRELMKDPAGMIARIYAAFEIPFSPEARNRIQAWMQNPTQHISARRFTLEEFGLDRATVEDAFGDYIDGYRDRF